MNIQEMSIHLDALLANTHPTTGESFGNDSVLHDPDLRRALGAARNHLLALRQPASSLPAADEILAICHTLSQLGYQPTVPQLVKLLLGSRTVVDPTLRALPAYGSYRGWFTRRGLEQFLMPISVKHPQELQAENFLEKRPTEAELQDEPFFDEDPFNELSEEKIAELRQELARLGCKRLPESLPTTLQKARSSQPRAYEPWTHAERALLIEAMCYTNQAEPLSAIFGRSPRAIVLEGKRLIFLSRSQRQTA